MTLARMKPDMKAQVTTASRPEPVAAHVRLVSPEVSPTTRLGRVRLAIAPAPGLTIGAFGRASVEIASHDGVLVPQSAVLYTEEGATVQVIKGDTVSTRTVTLGLRTESQAEIVKGVEAGDEVVATAGTFVRDGDKVAPVEATAATLRRSEAAMSFNISAWSIRYPVPVHRAVRGADGARLGLLPGPADHQIPQYRRAGDRGDGDASRAPRRPSWKRRSPARSRMPSPALPASSISSRPSPIGLGRRRSSSGSAPTLTAPSTM